jgi:asparagine synthase (glutamine-hydrolysing)
MCGIFGVWNYETREPVDTGLVVAARDSLRHRGPDASGLYTDDPAGLALGFRRLSIIDVRPEGNQPMTNEDGTKWLVFNGEIFNYPELRPDLVAKSHTFRSDSDSEVILHLFEEYGDRCVDLLRGMFAFALWDSVERRLLLARDRFGIKPLFVAEGAGRMAFASELEPLLTIPWVDRAWDSDGLAAYLETGYVPAPRTAYRGIRKFDQATTETWEQAGLQKGAGPVRRQYWAPSTAVAQPAPPFETAKATVMELLIEAVGLWMRSDVPLGAFLSGGLDSSSVVALMRACGKEEIKTFSIGFEEASHDEREFAGEVAKLLGTEHFSLVATASDARDVMGLQERFGEPFADSSMIPTYLVSKLAREQVTVALSGDGGDEVFAGYKTYAHLDRYRYVDWMPSPVRAGLGRVGAALIPANARGGGFVRRLDAKPEERFVSLGASQYDRFSMLSRRFRTALSESPQRHDWRSGLLCAPTVSAAQVVDQTHYLPDDILVKVDRSSMAVSLEARVPFLDHKLVDYVNSLPQNYKLHRGVTKLILRECMAPYLPLRALERPKMGFSVPLASWLSGPLSQEVRQHLLDNPLGLFDRGAVSSLVQAPLTRKTSNDVWRLLMLGAWAARHHDGLPW